MVHNNTLNIEALSIMTSLGCNLNCSYCHIAQAHNKNSSNMQKATIEALKDGSFLKNIKQTLFQLNQSSKNIHYIALWGQEPTLTLEHLSNNMEEWLNTFPNLNSIMFSTNSMAYGNKIVDFITAIDKNIDHPIHIDIQLSHDGEYGTDNIRNGDSSKIYKNLNEMFTALNSIYLEHVRLTFRFHGVVSMSLINSLNTFDKVYNYYDNMEQWVQDFLKKNNNKNITIAPELGLALETPVDATPEDGLKLAHFCKMSNHVYLQGNNHTTPSSLHTLYSGYLAPFMGVINELKRAGFNDINEFLKLETIDKKKSDQIYHRLSRHLYCGHGAGELKLMYDGTLVACQNEIFDTQLEYIKDEDTIKSQTLRSLASHNYYPNVIKDGLTYELDKYLDIFSVGKNMSFEFIFKSIAHTMLWMQKTHQIDDSYEDLNKLYEHAFILTVMNCCSYNNQIKTGSIFLRSTGTIRLFCNGYLDEVLKYASRREK